MIINLSRCLTLSVSVVALSAIPVEAAYFNYDTRLFKSSMIDTNTHTLKSESQSSALSSSPKAFNLRGLSIAPSDSNLSTSSFPQTASVCFITDTSDCGGIGAAGGEDNVGGGVFPDWDLDENKRCKNEGYSKVTCNSAQVPSNKCPYDDSYAEKCECKKDLVTCTKPQYGVGEACGGKYVSCQTDNPRACKEDGYLLSAACASTKNKEGVCPYSSTYYKNCVCKTEYKYSCSGVGYNGGSGSACDGKYSSCGCSSSYQWTGSVCSYVNPCAGYYECGGTWQYCTGSKCSADSSKCSVSCVSDYFPNKCDSSANCSGVYRNGYCSGSCCNSYYDCGGTWQYCTGSTCPTDSSKCSVSCVSDYFPNKCDSSANCSGVYRNGYCSGSCSSSSGGGSSGGGSSGGCFDHCSRTQYCPGSSCNDGAVNPGCDVECEQVLYRCSLNNVVRCEMGYYADGYCSTACDIYCCSTTCGACTPGMSRCDEGAHAKCKSLGGVPYGAGSQDDHGTCRTWDGGRFEHGRCDMGKRQAEY